MIYDATYITQAYAFSTYCMSVFACHAFVIVVDIALITLSFQYYNTAFAEWKAHWTEVL